MQMTNEEIIRDYTQAANKSKQIKVLAELNCVSPSEIRQILAEAGVEGVKAPARIAPRRSAPPETARELEAKASAPSGDELSVYDRIEAILAALPEDASEYVRNNAYNLVVALFSGYVEQRLGKETQTGT